MVRRLVERAHRGGGDPDKRKIGYTVVRGLIKRNPVVEKAVA